MSYEVKDSIKVSDTTGAGGRILSKEEILLNIQEHSEALRELYARLPQSDWHAAFESILRIELYGRSDVEVNAEVEIGVAPPRADFMVIRRTGDEAFTGDAFKLFRDINVIEFKRPEEAVNLRVIYKAIGYADLLFANARRESDVPYDQVTVSVFHPGRAPLALRRLESMGVQVHAAASGVYVVEGLTRFPLQVVAMEELDGKDNAKFRALSEHADATDIGIIDSEMRDAPDDQSELWRMYISLVIKKNVPLFERLKKEDKGMSSVILEIVRDEVDELVKAAAEEAAAKAAEEATAKTSLKEAKEYVARLVKNEGMDVGRAMEALEVPEEMRAEVAAFARGDGD